MILKFLHRIIYLIIWLLLSICITSTSQAHVKINIDGGYFDPTPIGIPYFSGRTGSEKVMGKKISRIIVQDLKSCGLFKTVTNFNMSVKNLNNINKRPDFSYFKKKHVDTFLQAKITLRKNKLLFAFRLYDIITKSQITSSLVKVEKYQWRRLSHIISDTIYNKITGEKGFFDTRVIFVDEQKQKTGQTVRTLAIMDQDGANVKYLTKGKYMILMPNFSPDGTQATYVSYEKGFPFTYFADLQTGEILPLQGVKKNMMVISPKFSRDAKSLFFAGSPGRNTDIYQMDIKKKKMIRLTTSKAIDVSPSQSPDKKNIVFSSDRKGGINHQKLFVMNLKTKKIKKISKGDGSYATPSWSPRGDLIAFTKILHGQFYIGIMSTDGSNEKILTGGYLVENPSWASSGRNIVFTREKINKGKKHSYLYVIDISGIGEHRLNTPHDASDASWSSPLPK